MLGILLGSQLIVKPVSTQDIIADPSTSGIHTCNPSVQVIVEFVRLIKNISKIRIEFHQVQQCFLIIK